MSITRRLFSFLGAGAGVRFPEAQSDDEQIRIDRLRRASRLSGIPIERVNITDWRPDTCGCSLAYVWDRKTMDTPEEREHVAFEACPCEHHSRHGSIANIHRSVVAENRGKNQAVAEYAKTNGIEPHLVPWRLDDKRNPVVG